MLRPLESLPSHQPAPWRVCESSPAADRRPSPPVNAGRRPAGPPPPLQATFRFEEAARQIVVTLVRPETQQVVLQIPPEKILKLIIDLRQLAARAFDKQA